MPTVRQAMRNAIKRAPKTRYRLCKETGVDASALTRFMAGRSGLSLEKLEQLANALDLEIVIRPRRKGQ